MKQRTPNATKLKAKINSYAKNNAISAQVVLQNFMFERLVERIARSRFAPNFVIKGGLLLSSMFGLDKRSTMDMDTTLVNYPLTEKKVLDAVQEILDSIVPAPVQFGYRKIFDDELFLVYSYPVETVLAEKHETILIRGILNKRPRDYYDVYMLTQFAMFSIPTLKRALLATAEHRGTKDMVEKEYAQRIGIIKQSEHVRRQWEKYRKTFSYAKDFSFGTVLTAVRDLLEKVMKS